MRPRNQIFGLLAAAGLAVVAAKPCAATLSAATSSVGCNSNNPVSSVTDPSGCTVGGGSASALFEPFASLSANASSSAGVATLTDTATLQYYFEVTGGSLGDHVPLLISTNLSSASSGYPAYGSAVLGVTTGLGSVGMHVCTDGSCPSGTGFSGTLAITALSGNQDEVTMSVEASITFLQGGTASASASPFIFIDPSFANASDYSILFSDGVGNSSESIPEPGSLCLLGIASICLARVRRRSAA